MKLKISAGILAIVLSRVVMADSVVQRAQEALKEQGYYYGETSGEKNSDTVAAIRRFQIRNGLQVTGELNEETIRALDAGSSSATSQSAQSPATAQPEATSAIPIAPPTSRPQTDVRPQLAQNVLGNTPYETAPPELQRRVLIGAQTLLLRRGFYKGRLDGVPGPQFQFSLRAYQSRIGLPSTGRLDMETLASFGLLPGQDGPAMENARRHPYPSQFGQPPIRGEWIREKPEERGDEDDND